MITAIIYNRVSSKRQEEEGNGLSSQESVCREFAARKGIPVERVFSDTFTGKSVKRVGLSALIAHVKKNRTKKFVVIFDDISRLARELSGHIEVVTTLRKFGCLLISPSHEFKEDPDSILVENLLASVSQHHSMKNSEQVKSRRRGRLLLGYWPFNTPFGLKFRVVKGSTSEIVKDGSKAEIVKEALSGYAINHFNNVADVQRFLQGQREFTGGKKGARVTIMRAERMLRNPLYCGYFEYAKYDIPLQRGNLPQIVDYETHVQIIRKLDGGKKSFRSNLDKDFPVRGFLTCADCGGPMSACWSKGKKMRYGYYFCYKAGCSSCRKSVPCAKLHTELTQILENLKPSAQALIAFWDFVEEASLLLRQSITVRQAAFTKEASELLAAERKLVDKIARFEDDDIVLALTTRLKEIKSERILVDVKLRKLTAFAPEAKAPFEHSKPFLANPSKTWEDGDLGVRRSLLKVCFLQPLKYDRNRGFRTPKLSPAFKALGDAEDGETELAGAT